MAASDDSFSKKASLQMILNKLDSPDLPKELEGKPLKIHHRNFSVSADKEIQSYISRAPEFAIRARRIEDAIERLYSNLENQYNKLNAEYGIDSIVFKEKWTDIIDNVELDEINELIDKHNKYYPIEAGLPLDPMSGQYMFGAIPWKGKEKITKVEIIRRFLLNRYL